MTVLFVDVKGSVELSAEVGPEEWHGIMERFFRILADGVHRFEGTVNQYTGDGIMALFGAPIAHEDHAQRACYAALHLKEELRRYADELKRSRGLGFAVRIGINSGEVVVGRIGDDLRMDYTALGHTASLAARMEQIAEPGKAYVTEHTAKLVEGFVTLQDLGPLKVKGAKEPVRVYELHGLGRMRTKLEVSRARGLSTFVGREREMSLLEDALERANAGETQIVGVVAAAGIGKSRLCFEFLDRCRSRGIPVFEGYGVPHGKAVPFLPILELYRRLYGISGGDDPASARLKVREYVQQLGEEFSYAVPIVLDFLGLADPAEPAPAMDVEARQRQIGGVIRRALRTRSRHGPGVVIFEDLHWFDAASETIVGQIAGALAGTRFLLIATFRPHYRAPWMEAPYYQQLALSPLTGKAGARLSEALLGTDPSVTPLARQVEDRSGGNPFFAEEIVRMLAGEGRLVGAPGAYRLSSRVDEIHVPETVQAVLAARIDRLSEDEKHFLQAAAVIGKRFPLRILRSVVSTAEGVVDSVLSSLSSEELIYEEDLDRQEPVYSFRHPLTQEVAYRSQLADRRRRTHADVARAIAKLESEALDDAAALIAHHWEEAGDPFEASRWHERAARRMEATDAEASLHHWSRIRELLGTRVETAEALALATSARVGILQAAAVAGMSESETSAVFQEATAFATRGGDVRSHVHALLAHALFRMFGGAMAEQLALYSRAAQLAAGSSDAGLRLLARGSLAHGHFAGGDLRAAQSVNDEVIAELEQHPELQHTPMGSLAFIHRGAYAVFTGHLHDALRLLRIAEDRCERDQNVPWQSAAWAFHSLAAYYSGDVVEALDTASRCVALAERTGGTYWRIEARMKLGEALLLAGRWDEAIETVTATLALCRERRVGLWFEPYILSHLAEARLGRGEMAEARIAAEEARDVMRRGAAIPFFACAVNLANARVLQSTAGARAAATITDLLDEAVAVIDGTGAEVYRSFVHAERAKLAGSIGDPDAHARELREAHRLF
ncbi:MAG: ATP-binding protein, partial [Candidatus Binatia bacterium]